MSELLISTVRDTVTERLRELILSGELEPGAPLRQDELANRFGVSHVPVREALRQLDAEGIVTIRPRRGAAVTTLSAAELDEIIHVRQILETDLLARAIPAIAAAHLNAARAVLDEIIKQPDRQAYSGQNWRFHAALYQPADAPLTLDILQRLHRIGDRYLRNEQDFVSVDAEHRRLLDLVAKRRKREAVAFLKVHIGDLRQRLRSALPPAAGRD